MEAHGTRLVVLGASNVARGLPELVLGARGVVDGPIQLMVALGHGRSYGLVSSFLGRQLPGILHCDVWRALEASGPAPTLALVSDAGNDILYGVEPDELARWVEECVDRLQAHDSAVALMRPPVARLATLSRMGFETARRLFFPGRPLAFEEALERLAELDLRLADVARRCGIRALEPPRAWYGVDPIHITRRARAGAWREMLGTVAGAARSARQPSSRVPMLQWLALRASRPAHVRFLGFELGVEQPARRLPDGSTLSLF